MRRLATTAVLLLSSTSALAQTDTVEILTDSDAMVRNGMYADMTHAQQIAAGQAEIDILTVLAFGSPDFESEVLVHFDLTQVTTPVVSARLLVSVRFLGNNPMGPGAPVTRDVYVVNDDNWNEDQVTWNTHPGRGALVDTFTATQRGWLEVDVTSLVQSEVAGDGALSFSYANQTNPPDEGWLDLWSRERPANAPRLVVETMSGPPTSIGLSGDVTLPAFMVGTAPSSAQVQVGFTGGPGGAWTAQVATGDFFTLSQAQGTGDGSFTVVANAGLAAGNYDGAVMVSAPGAQNSPATARVSLSVTDEPPVQTGALDVIDPLVIPTFAVDGAPTTLAVDVAFAFGMPTSWTVTAPSTTFFTVDGGGGAGAGQFTLRASNGLPEGTYTETIVITAPGAPNSPLTRGVALTVGPAGSAPAPNPDPLTSSRRDSGGCDCSADHDASPNTMWILFVTLVFVRFRRAP